jgi:hypothetical protein
MYGEKHLQLGASFGNDGGRDLSIYSTGDFRTAVRRGDRVLPLDLTTPSSNAAGFGSWHTGICQFAFGDGSVRAISVGIPVNVLSQLATRDGGEVVNLGLYAP